MELRYIRMLSNMSSLTYFMSKLTPETLKRRHGLRLVTSSLSCEASRRLPLLSPLQAMVDGDATAADVSRIVSAQGSAASKAPAMQAFSRIEPLVVPQKATATPPAITTTTAAAAPPPAQAPGTSSTPSPTEIVANSLSAAAAAAATAASSAAGSVYSAAAPLAAPIANNISTFASSATSPLASVASQLQNAAAAGQAGTVATLATVSAAVMSGKISPTSAAQQCVSPTEWYVADDEESHLRYFVIQGSDNMDHWKVNLTFDPVTFEDSSLGVKVHRGVYETAMILYDRFLPLVQDHVASSPSARIAFTGHSLGGSLATLLMMMFLKRGVLSAENLAPVYTFGAPAIFCEGAAGGCGGDGTDCSIPNSSSSGSSGNTSGSPEGLLKKLGLPSTSVRNVLMHKDIVPRAFACDYSLVADLLRRVGESFREHKCLNGNRRVMFNFVGKMIVLQPDAKSSFVSTGEGYHPMLPQKPGMFVVREPTVAETMDAQMQREVQMVADVITNLPATASSAMDVPSRSTSPIHRIQLNVANSNSNIGATTATAATTTAPSSVGKPRPAASSSDEALWQLMNFPHPLDILADPGAYGDQGSISRYHNPDNYTRAIGGVLRARGAAYKNVVQRAKDSGMSFKPPSLGRKDHASSAAAVVGEAPSSPTAAASRNGGSGGGKMHSPLAVRRSPSFSSS
jgi:Lipase (class 3)